MYNNRLERIARVLLLNSSFIENLGLMHGKMGIAIYFFHMGNLVQNQVYTEYAGELIDEVYDEISSSIPFDFENGLAGIGWGIEYLAQNGFIEADTNEILEVIDNRLALQFSYNTPTDCGLLNGLVGLGRYFLKRIQNVELNCEDTRTLTNKQTLILLIDELDRRLRDEQIKKLLIETNGILTQVYSREAFDYTWNYSALIIFLAEVCKLDIFNFKIRQIVQRLLVPLYESKNIPREHSKRLQLILALDILKKCDFAKEENYLISKLIQDLSSKISRYEIMNELIPSSVCLRNGTTGIALLCKQLFDFTGEITFKEECRFWKDQTFVYDELDNGYAGFVIPVKKKHTAFGLQEGLAGIALLELDINVLNF